MQLSMLLHSPLVLALAIALPGMALGVALGAFAQVPASTPGDSLADIGPRRRPSSKRMRP